MGKTAKHKMKQGYRYSLLTQKQWELRKSDKDWTKVAEETRRTETLILCCKKHDTPK